MTRSSRAHRNASITSDFGSAQTSAEIWGVNGVAGTDSTCEPGMISLRRQVPNDINLCCEFVDQSMPNRIDGDQADKRYRPQKTLCIFHTPHRGIPKIARKQSRCGQTLSDALFDQAEIGQAAEVLWKRRQIHIRPPCRVQRVQNSARHPGQFRNSPNVLESTAGKRALYGGIQHVRGQRRDESTGEARSQQRKRENIPADHTFARGDKALTVEGQWAVNNNSRPHARSPNLTLTF